jgi:hypothetical protein
MPNYKHTKIYTIRNHINDKVFVGFTTTRVCEAFNSYKQLYKKRKHDNPLFKAFDEIGVDNFYTRLEAEVQCKTKEPVNSLVNEHIKKYDSVNNGYNYVRKRTQASCKLEEQEEVIEEDVNKAIEELKMQLGITEDEGTSSSQLVEHERAYLAACKRYFSFFPRN